jgi:large subunit ribosomal protein L1
MAGKKYENALKKVDRMKKYPITDACELLPQVKISSKFDETVNVSVRLGVNPKHADQMVRGAVVFPNGTGKTTRVLVIAKGDKAKDAREAGADHVGAEDFIEKIQKENWFEFDSMVATPDMMGLVGRLGKVLGPRGLMPNPKSGTVTFDVTKAVNELKAGKIEFRVDKGSNVHAPLGKASFPEDRLLENARVFIRELLRAKPAATKGHYLKTLTLSSTMGPGIALDPAAVEAAVGH